MSGASAPFAGASSSRPPVRRYSGVGRVAGGHERKVVTHDGTFWVVPFCVTWWASCQTWKCGVASKSLRSPRTKRSKNRSSM